MLLQYRACSYSIGHVVTVLGMLSVSFLLSLFNRAISLLVDGSLGTMYVVQILQHQFALRCLFCIHNNTTIFMLTVSAVKLPRYRHDIPLHEVGGCCRSFLTSVHGVAHVFQQLVDLFLRQKDAAVQ